MHGSVNVDSVASSGRRRTDEAAATLRTPASPLTVLCIGAHSDDIEIGVGATILGWIERGVRLNVHWTVLSASDQRAVRSSASAETFLAKATCSVVEVARSPDSFSPPWGRHQAVVRGPKGRTSPDIVFCHWSNDAHQDHREVSQLTWNTFRNHMIFEYEIPKWDGDLGRPNIYVPASRAMMERKVQLLNHHFGTQRSKDWFDAQNLPRSYRRGAECRAPKRGSQKRSMVERSWSNKQKVIVMRVMVTGHLGYIGTCMVPMLLRSGHEVVRARQQSL